MCFGSISDSVPRREEIASVWAMRVNYNNLNEFTHKPWTLPFVCLFHCRRCVATSEWLAGCATAELIGSHAVSRVCQQKGKVKGPRVALPRELKSRRRESMAFVSVRGDWEHYPEMVRELCVLFYFCRTLRRDVDNSKRSSTSRHGKTYRRWYGANYYTYCRGMSLHMHTQRTT